MHKARPEGNLTVTDHRQTISDLEAALVIDLSGIKEVDSVAVATLVGVVRKMHFNGRTVRFANVPKLLAGLINLYEAGEFFKEAEGA